MIAVRFLDKINGFLRAPGPNIKNVTAGADQSDHQAHGSRFFLLLQPEDIAKLTAQNHHRHGPKWCMSCEKIDFIHRSIRAKKKPSFEGFLLFRRNL